MRQVFGLLFVATCAACAGGSEQSMRDALSRLDLTRTTVPRLSIHATYVECADGSTCGSQRLAPQRLRAIDSLATRASIVLRDHLDLDALHTAALLDLLWTDSSGISLHRAISSLRTVARLSDDPAPALADLSAALLVESERSGSTDDLLEAIDAAARSVTRDSMGLPQRFNLALGLDRLGVTEQAAQAWTAYLALDSESPWSNEARTAANRARQTVAVGDSLTTFDSIPDAHLSFVAAMAPEHVRQAGWDRVLGAWGDAALAGDSTRAASLLQRAATLGRALTRNDGDETLLDAARFAQQDRNATVTFARAYRAYSRGRRAFTRGDFTTAQMEFDTAAADRRIQPVASWAQTYLAATSMQTGHPKRALEEAGRANERIDSTRYPALAAQIDWVGGVALLRMANYDRAIQRLQSARSRFARAGEGENAGAVETNIGEANWYVIGDRMAAGRAYAHALSALQRYRHSVFLHNVLADFVDLASAGPIMAATRLQDEDVTVAALSGSPAIRTDARIVRARLRRLIGDGAGADKDGVAATALLDSVPRGALHNWLQANVQMTRVPAAAPALDSAVEFFHSNNNPLLELQAVLERGEQWSLANDTARTAADLVRALQLMDGQATALERTPLRVALLESTRRVVDRLVALESRQPRRALETLERARGSLARLATRTSLDAVVASIPAGTAVIDIAAIGDTIYTWTIRDRTIRLHRLDQRVESLRRVISRLTSALELRVGGPLVENDLDALYDDLMRPVLGDFGSRDTSLIIIADGDFAAIPFAALRDRVSARYLIETHALRFASSLSDLTTTTHVALAGTPSSVLVIADPAFDPRVHPTLGRLPGARVEADSVAALYPTAELLTDTAANRQSVLGALRRASIVHFAGHAIIDDDDPGRSVLVLGSDLDAGAIAQLDLHHIRLVVLSACETSIMRGRAAGLAGLTGAFLRAGAEGVVGSLWRVDDRFGQPLMLDLHRAFAASGDGPQALRAAQLSMLHSSNSTLRSPAAWAGFRYFGS